MLEALEAALRETPYSAVVQRQRVNMVSRDADEVKFAYHVKVLDSIRGPKLKQLTYYAYFEPDEVPSPATGPVILTLCKDREGFYWPGTGAQFTPTKEALALVNKLRPQLEAAQKVFAQCETP